MSGRTKLLESTVSTLKHELELSTFLNKGVLQTNSELKLRIAELERENCVLRVAESRLSSTEDELEGCQKELKERGERLVELLSQVKRLKGLEGRVKGLEGERDGLIRTLEGVREGWEGCKRDMDGVLGSQMEIGEEDERGGVNGVSGSSARRRRKQQDPSKQPRERDSRGGSSKPNHNATAGPSRARPTSATPSPVFSTSASTRKRRRVQESPPDGGSGEDNEGEEGYERTPSMSPPSRKHPAPAPRKSSSKKDVPRPPSTSIPSTTKNRQSAVNGRRVSNDVKVKVEVESPEPEAEGDSDDDPLAMN